MWLQRAGAGGLVRAEGRAGRRRSWARGGWLIPNTNTCTNANTNTNTNANTNWMYSGCSHLKLTKRNTCPFLWPKIPWKCKPWRYFQMIIVVSNKLLCANAQFFTIPKRILKLREGWYLQQNNKYAYQVEFMLFYLLKATNIANGWSEVESFQNIGQGVETCHL